MATLSDLVTNVANRLGCTKVAAREAVDAVFAGVKDATIEEGARLAVPEFGIFRNKRTPARTATNPVTRQPVDVPSKLKLTFKGSK